MAWRMARALDVLLGEINLAWPNRSKKSDGSIGDQAHQNRTSDHNPDARGLVKARDFDITSLPAVEARELAERIRASMMRRGVRGYVIFNRRICSSDVDRWDWRPYDGDNPHNHHIHVSVHSDVDSPYAWNIAPTMEGIDPMITAADIAKAVWAAQTGRGDRIAAMSLRVARAERDAAATLGLTKVIAATVGVTAEQVAQILGQVTAADEEVAS